jgi:hypothetical protein
MIRIQETLSPPLDGTGRQQCVHCGYRSVPGLVHRQGLCPYHWAVFQWGAAWANQLFPDWHPKPEPR